MQNCESQAELPEHAHPGCEQPASALLTSTAMSTPAISATSIAAAPESKSSAEAVSADTSKETAVSVPSASAKVLAPVGWPALQPARSAIRAWIANGFSRTRSVSARFLCTGIAPIRCRTVAIVSVRASTAADPRGVWDVKTLSFRKHPPRQPLPFSAQTRCRPSTAGRSCARPKARVKRNLAVPAYARQTLTQK